MQNTQLQQQRSEDWFKIRESRFTGSEIWKLLVGGKRDMTDEELEQYKKENPKGRKTTIESLFGETALTYIFEKSCESIMGVDEEDQLDTFDVRRGKELEPLAFRKFKELKELQFLDVQECSFFAWGDNSGASPDCVVSNDAVGEFKCPRSKKLFKIIHKGIEAIDKEYIAQMQWEIFVTNSKRCHFFNYGIFNSREIWHELIIERDEKMIEDIKMRVLEAVKIRDKYIEELKNNIQFDLLK